MVGENYVRMVGYLSYPNFTTTNNGIAKFAGKIGIPVSYTDKSSGEQKEFNKHYKFTAWAEVAKALADVPDGSLIRIVGEYNERSYEGSCKACATVEKKYYTDVNVRGFEVLENE